ncbi:MAG TPA: M24 family metallopeptidase [Candidatus Binatia bacterium]|jgi:Xaa-Pro aminopeptidase
MAYTPPKRAGATVYIWSNYSVQERDRRWKAVKERGAKAGFDCIFVPLGDGIDARYLTQLRCSSVIMPTDGRAPIIIADRSSRNTWAPEPWQTSREWSEPMAEALLECGMERARIGVAGLKGGKVSHVTSIDGVVNHGAFSAVLRRMPNAKFEDATDVIGFVRYVKSAEEIDAMKKATEIAEAGIDELKRMARPGADEAVVYANVMARMLELGAEYYPFAWTTGAIDSSDAKRSANPPLGRRLKANSLIQSEMIAVFGTQIAEEGQAILLGKIPEAWKPAIERQREVFNAGLKFLAPGKSSAEVIDFAKSFAEKNGMKTEILLSGRGAGDDGPVIKSSTSADALKGISIEKNTLWLWRPTVTGSDAKTKFTWGSTVLVGENGGEVLSKRSHGVISVA